MKIQPLTGIDMPIITDCFNLAFANYFVKFNATVEYLENRWSAANVDYSLSFGVFDHNQLVGFAIHAVGNRKGELMAFDIGAGVIPSHRGQRLIQQMYDFGLPLFKKKGITQVGLEVIQENERAIKAYKKVGFSIDRALNCYRLNEPKINAFHLENVKIRRLKHLDADQIRACHDFLPPWENTLMCINRKVKDLDLWEIYNNSNWYGYAVVDKTGFIIQFGILPKYRKQKLGTLLFNTLVTHYRNLRVVNIDANSLSTIQFLEKFGFENTINQYEMYWKF